MYEAYYALKENPFRLTPDPAFICMTSQHQEALSGLIYSVCTRPGLTVLAGEAGTGKTTLLYSLTELLEKRQVVTAVCSNPTLTRDEFYDLLLMKFGVACESSLKSRRLCALEETILRNRAAGRASLFIVDEAQRLSTELLEEVRLLLNLETATEKLLHIIVAGQPELEEVLRKPELRQLKQRVSSVCRLHPLSVGDTREYLNHRLTHAGIINQILFSPEVIDLLYVYTQGIPRLINSLCDAALQTGFALQSPTITKAIIEEAARDLDLAPVPPPEAPSLLRSNMTVASAGMMGGPIPTPAPQPQVASEEVKNGNNGAVALEVRIPFENYSRRQQGLGFFANLLDRWK